MDKGNKIVKKLCLCLFICIFMYPLQAFSKAVMTYEVNPDGITFELKFDNNYFNVREHNDGKVLVVTFETKDEIYLKKDGQLSGTTFVRQDFFDQHVESVWLTTDGFKRNLYFSFENDKVVKPTAVSNDKYLSLNFVIPQNEKLSAPSGMPGAGAYIRMFFGLSVIIAVIIICYLVMRFFFKTNMITDIPGVGRLLGKVNIDLKKQLIFYELGETIYIMASSDNGTNLIDKITDPIEITVIKSGFSKRKNFSSYMKIFRQHQEIATDLKSSKEIIEEKVSSLKKR